MTGLAGDPRVDPDPFAVAAVVIAATSLAGQFVQIYKAFNPSRPPSSQPGFEAQRIPNLEALEQQVEDLQRKLRSMLRVLDRAISPTDALYDAPVRAAETELLMSPSDVSSYGNGLADVIAGVSGLSRWINNIIAYDSNLASRLGSRMKGADGWASRVNRIIEDGRPTREAVEECKHVLAQLAGAIEAELRSISN